MKSKTVRSLGLLAGVGLLVVATAAAYKFTNIADVVRDAYRTQRAKLKR